MTEAYTRGPRIALLGGGPTALFVFKHLVATGDSAFTVDIFEATSRLGGGMPYSAAGAGVEHITNVSCDEIPPLVTPILDWLDTLPANRLAPFDVDRERFSEHKVLPRLLFGDYLEQQFALLLEQARDIGLRTTVHTEVRVTDVIDQRASGTVQIELNGTQRHEYDHVVICTGHNWPRPHEGRIPHYFDSPYPPSKLARRFDHPIAMRGSSLTAVDAIRTLARQNGTFTKNPRGSLEFQLSDGSPQFRIVMHSRHGLLPCVRFHTETAQIGKGGTLSQDEVAANIIENDGFLSLDFIFDTHFKAPLREKDPAFYERIADMNLEQFVDAMLGMRESVDAFSFFKGEYAEAQKSIRRKESIHWKEMLSALSFAMNYPAKHMSAEDMMRHKRVLMPLISIVIAFLPQSSCEELIALHDAGVLDIISVGTESYVEPREEGGATYHYTDDRGNAAAVPYDMFVDCVGQPHLSLDAFPFTSLVRDEIVAPAKLRFRDEAVGAQMRDSGDECVEGDIDGKLFLRVGGIAINDCFQVLGANDVASSRIFMLAVPYIGGHNPDYSGLDYCEEAGGIVVRTIVHGGGLIEATLLSH